MVNEKVTVRTRQSLVDLAASFFCKSREYAVLHVLYVGDRYQVWCPAQECIGAVCTVRQAEDVHMVIHSHRDFMPYYSHTDMDAMREGLPFAVIGYINRVIPEIGTWVKLAGGEILKQERFLPSPNRTDIEFPEQWIENIARRRDSHV